MEGFQGRLGEATGCGELLKTLSLHETKYFVSGPTFRSLAGPTKANVTARVGFYLRRHAMFTRGSNRGGFTLIG